MLCISPQCQVIRMLRFPILTLDLSAELRDMVHLGIKVVRCWLCILLYAFFALPLNSNTISVPKVRWKYWAHQTQAWRILCLAILTIFCSSTTIWNQITLLIHKTLQFHGTFTKLIHRIAIHNLSLRLWGCRNSCAPLRAPQGGSSFRFS